MASMWFVALHVTPGVGASVVAESRGEDGVAFAQWVRALLHLAPAQLFSSVGVVILTYDDAWTLYPEAMAAWE